MKRGLVATATATIETPVSSVWEALVNPETIRQYMFGTTVSSDWRPGSAITWAGEWLGRKYEDRGTITRIQPGRLLEYTHYSPLSGLPDVPGSYHTVTIELEDLGGRTEVRLSQDNNATEEARQHSEKNWAAMLDGMKALLES
jgi:uncharacterized protein YndB with AHSA1/START domain